MYQCSAARSSRSRERIRAIDAPCLGSPGFLEKDIDVVRVDQVGHGPALQVILRHALFGEAFEALSLTRRHGSLERLDANLIVAPSIVALVEFVSTAELGPHCVP